MSSTASSYSGRFSRFRQSSSVIFQLFSGLFWRFSKRCSCSSGETSIQNLTSMPPSAQNVLSKPTIVG